MNLTLNCIVFVFIDNVRKREEFLDKQIILQEDLEKHGEEADAYECY